MRFVIALSLLLSLAPTLAHADDIEFDPEPARPVAKPAPKAKPAKKAKPDKAKPDKEKLTRDEVAELRRLAQV